MLFNIFGGRLVKVSWEVISKISFKVFKKNDFNQKKKMSGLKKCSISGNSDEKNMVICMTRQPFQ